jgi:hypothetical protein
LFGSIIRSTWAQDLDVHGTWLLDGKELSTVPTETLSGDSADGTATWTNDGQRHWLRAEVRTSAGTLQLLSNPIFLNWTAKS